MSDELDINNVVLANASKPQRDARLLAIRKVLDEDIRPYVQADGGDIELASIDGNIVRVRLSGACGTCPSSQVTLKQGVQARLQAKISPDLVIEEVT